MAPSEENGKRQDADLDEAHMLDVLKSAFGVRLEPLSATAIVRFVELYGPAKVYAAINEAGTERCLERMIPGQFDALEFARANFKMP